jgi:hypothetical protein
LDYGKAANTDGQTAVGAITESLYNANVVPRVFTNSE